MLEALLLGFIGILLGVITGLTPGIHNNTVNTILISLIPIFSLKTISLVAFIVTLAITHTIIDFIPSIFTGATDGDSFLATLPGHEMLSKGQGVEAVKASVLGACISLPIIILIAPLFIISVPKIIALIKTAIPFILFFVSLYSLLREKYLLTSISIWLLAGFLGYSAFNLPVKDPLLPLLSGLFGGSGLILSIVKKTKIPKQKESIKLKFEKGELKKAVIGATISAPLCSFLPAIGSGHAATIGSEIFSQTKKGFMVMLGAINITVMILSFATLYAIDKTRTGAAAAVKEVIPSIARAELMLIIAIAIISAVLASLISVKLAKVFAKKINKINYSFLSIIMLAVLLTMILIFSNLLGLIVFVTGTALGIFAIQSNTRRINLMGCLMIPTIIYYLIS